MTECEGHRAGGDEYGGERLRSATLFVPTPLNVDDDAASDVVATLGISSLNQVTLTIARQATETAVLPLAVEAILSDDGGGSLPQSNVSFGYDARTDRAPGEFELSLALPAPGTDVLAIDLSQAERGEEIALIADLFDGTPILDIKPYIPYADAFPEAKAGWIDDLRRDELQYRKREPAEE